MSLNTYQRSRSQHISKACFEALEDRRLLSFTPGGSYAAGANLSAIATADFNNDGKLDLASAGGFSTRVGVRLGDGAGGFGAAQEYGITRYPASIFAADLTEDGRPDLIAAGPSDGYSTLISNGDGTFQPEAFTVDTLTSVQPWGNGAIAVRTYTDADWGSHVQLQYSNGQGGFVAAGFDTTYSGATVVPVDLNKDAWLDVAAGDGTVVLGVPGGLQYDWSQQPSLTGGAITTGDFTGDGYADVIIAGSGVAVLRSKGDGTLHSPILHSANGTSHSAVATADFNADGKLDAIVTDHDTGTVSVMLGNGDGTLRFAGAFATGTSPSSIAVGDFNRDGRPDAAVTNPGSRTVSVLLNDGNWNVAPPPPPVPPALSVSDVTLTEGNTGTRNATFTVTLSKPAAADVSVNYGTADISASADSDYNATAGSVVIPAGQTSKTFTVAVKGDRLPEPTETFTVNLNSPTNATIADGQGIGTILDDEPRISINSVSKTEGNSKMATLTFTVSLSAVYDQPVTVKYATANGTATANGDYASKSGTLTFAAGETTKTITIIIKGDRTKESTETFYLNLFGASSNSVIGVSRGTGTILDDDR